MPLKVIPVAQVLLAGLVMYIVDWLLPQGRVIVPMQSIVGLLVLIPGLIIFMAAGIQFRQAKTTVNPIHPEQATSLVVCGIYRFTRNPMYLGFLSLLLAWAISLGNLFCLLVPVFFVWVMTEWQIKPEERALLEKFGDDYATYLASVRRWL